MRGKYADGRSSFRLKKDYIFSHEEGGDEATAKGKKATFRLPKTLSTKSGGKC